MLSDENIIIICASVAGFCVIIGAVVCFVCIRKRQNEEFKPLLDSKGMNKSRSISGFDPEEPMRNQMIEKKKQAEKEELTTAIRLYLRATKYHNPILLDGIGSRSTKLFFTVKENSRNSQLMILSLSTIPKTCKFFATEHEKASIIKALSAMKHPYLLPCKHVDYAKERNALVIVRDYFTNGSLKDLIHDCKPAQTYKDKYDPVKGDPLPEKKVKLYSKQILEALIYLTAHRWPVYSIHTGNIFLEDGVCKISEYETDLIGVPSKIGFVWKSLIEKKIPLQVAATYVFGAIFYEMVVGYELDNVHLDDIPHDVYPEAKKLLKKIFEGKMNPENGAPKEEQQQGFKNELNVGLIALRDEPYFKDVQLYSDWETQPIQMDKRLPAILQSVHEGQSNIYFPVPEKKTAPSVAIKKSPSTAVSPSVSVASTPKTQAPTSPNANITRSQSNVSISSATSPSSSFKASAPVPQSKPISVAQPAPKPVEVPAASGERTALLSSIESFNSKKLKKTVTVDKSKPRL